MKKAVRKESGRRWGGGRIRQETVAIQVKEKRNVNTNVCAHRYLSIDLHVNA
jgi:hypothetical protein